MLFDAIVDRYGKREGLTLRGDVIEEWPYAVPIPSRQELAVIEAEYKVSNEFKYKRDNEFPNLERLIKLLWNDIDSGQDLKLGGFYLAIKAVYDKYPDPNA